MPLLHITIRSRVITSCQEYFRIMVYLLLSFHYVIQVYNLLSLYHMKWVLTSYHLLRIMGDQLYSDSKKLWIIISYSYYRWSWVITSCLIIFIVLKLRLNLRKQSFQPRIIQCENLFTIIHKKISRKISLPH